MFSGAISQKKATQIHQSYFQGLREIRNQKAEEAYFAQLSKEEQEKNPQKEDFLYFRQKWEGSPMGRVNLYSLIGKNLSIEPLFKMTIDYLERLYGEVFHQRKDTGLIKKILKKILKTQTHHLRTNNDLVDLLEITFEDPYLQQKYLKMLKGTNTYNLGKGQGYLPLKQVIEFEKSSDAPIQFNYANVILLESLFGEKGKNKIIEEQKEAKERRNTYALKENILREITSKYNPHWDVISLLSFKNTSNTPPITWTDPNTNITVRINSDY